MNKIRKIGIFTNQTGVEKEQERGPHQSIKEKRQSHLFGSRVIVVGDNADDAADDDDDKGDAGSFL